MSDLNKPRQNSMDTAEDSPEVFTSIESFTSRPLYAASLYFHPKHERRFGHIIGPIELPRDTPRAKCGISNCGSRFWLGYVISTSDGKETNIGKDCGKKHLDADYDRFVAQRRRIDDLREQQRKAARVLELVESLPSLISQLQAIALRYKEHQQLKVRLRGAVEKSVMDELTRRARTRESAVTREIHLSGRDAEAFRMNPANKGKRAVEERLIGTLSGLEVLSVRMASIIDLGIIPRLDELYARSRSGPMTMSSREVNYWSKYLGDLPAAIEQAWGLLVAGDKFFTPENLRLVSLMGGAAASLDDMIRSIEIEQD